MDILLITRKLRTDVLIRGDFPPPPKPPSSANNGQSRIEQMQKMYALKDQPSKPDELGAIKTKVDAWDPQTTSNTKLNSIPGQDAKSFSKTGIMPPLPQADKVSKLAGKRSSKFLIAPQDANATTELTTSMNALTPSINLVPTLTKSEGDAGQFQSFLEGSVLASSVSSLNKVSSKNNISSSLNLNAQSATLIQDQQPPKKDAFWDDDDDVLITSGPPAEDLVSWTKTLPE